MSLRTAHRGQLARFVGSPVMFVPLTVTADKTISKTEESEGFMMALCGSYKRMYFRKCYFARTTILRTSIFPASPRDYL